MTGKADSDVLIEVIRKSGFDQGCETGAAEMVRSDFAFLPALLQRGATSEPSLSAILVVLEVGEGFGDLVRVLSTTGAFLENEESFVASDEGLLEFDQGGVVFLTPKCAEFPLEGEEVFGFLFEAG